MEEWSIKMKITRFFTDPVARFYAFQELGFYNHMSDEKFLKKKFLLRLGYELNFDDPKSFNEKVQWLKMYDRNPDYVIMVDKYMAKDYIRERIGNEYIIPTLGVYEKFDDIDFDKLPSKFVIKTTHDCGGVYICENIDTFDKAAARRKINKHLNKNYFYSGREWPYKSVVPRIIVETYIGTPGVDLKDYKIMCFNGKVKCSLVTANRYTDEGLQLTFFDRDWNLLPFKRKYPMIAETVAKPQFYEKMVEISEKLSKDMKLLRVDFYETDGKLYIGELTLYPAGGFETFDPVEWDYKLGNLLSLKN